MLARELRDQALLVPRELPTVLYVALYVFVFPFVCEEADEPPELCEHTTEVHGHVVLRNIPKPVRERVARQVRPESGAQCIRRCVAASVQRLQQVQSAEELKHAFDLRLEAA